MNREIRVLLVEDAETEAEMVVRELVRAGLKIRAQRVDTRTAFVRELETQNTDIILSDFTMPRFNGLEALAIARKIAPDVPFIFVSGTIGEESAVQVLHAGATDYVLKGHLARLPAAVQRALTQTEERAARKKSEQELLRSIERFRILARATNDAVWDWDLVSNEVWRNDGFQTLFGHRIQDVKPSIEFWIEHIHAEDRERVHAKIHAAIDQGKQFWSDEYRFLRADGSAADIYDRGYILHDEQGDATRMIGAMVDVTELKRKETALRAAEEKLSGILNSIDQVVWSVSAPSRELVYLNPAAEKVYGRSAGDFYQDRKLWHEIVHPEDRERVERMLPSLRHQGKMTIEYRIVRADGEVRWLEDRAHAILDAQGNVVRYDGLATDVTDRKKHERQIEYLATHDGLTDLPNRNLLSDRLAQARNHARRTGFGLALLFLDLDRFKFVNDGYGHPMGDALLKVVARELKKMVREGDTVSRLGGDEFVVLLADLKRPLLDASSVASKILDRFSLPLVVDGRELTLTASIGVSLYPDDGHDLDILLMNADAAMYRAKDSGRNTFQFYTREMSQKAIERVSLEESLRRALELEQFELHYQPQVDIASGRIIGMEALIRWQHPKMGMVSPAKFIPVAEETGLIVSIGEWVLKTACAQGKAWVEAGFSPFPVAVNLSARQLRQGNLAATIAQSISDSGFRPQYLELELTESMVMGNLDSVVAILKHLKALGIKLAMDDFGTGYSNLGNLKSFPLDRLKIDQSFVRNITANPHDVAIARTIIALGKSLALNVTAEGVETEEQRDILRDYGCDSYQGYFFSRPLPANELTKILQDNEQRKGHSAAKR